MARMGRRGGFRGRTTSKRRAREWVQFWTAPLTDPDTEAYVSVSPLGFAVIPILDPLDMAEAFDEPTLVRAILRWNIVGQPMVTGTEAFVRLGLLHMNYNVDIGPASPPDLLLDGAHHGWLWMTSLAARNPAASSFAFANAGGDKVSFEDVRTKRKFQDGDALLAVFRNDTNSDVQFHFHLTGRLLFLN